VHALHAWMKDELARAGVTIHGVYFCPHHPDITGECVCRKPNPGMLANAARDFGLSLNDSWMIGDSDRDIMAGREANTKTIKVGEAMDPTLKIEPHHYAADLWEAVQIIVP